MSLARFFRTISRYFRCSRFGFRRGFKLSVFTLLLNAPRAAGMRAFIAIKEIKRRRRAAQKGEMYGLYDASLGRVMSCDAPDVLEKAHSLSSALDSRRAEIAATSAEGQTPVAASPCHGSDAEVTAEPPLVSGSIRGNNNDAASPSVRPLPFSGSQLTGFGGHAIMAEEVPAPGEAAATANAGPLMPDAISRPHDSANLTRDLGAFHGMPGGHGTGKVLEAPLEVAEGVKCDSSTALAPSPHIDGNPLDSLRGSHVVSAQFDA